MSCGASDQEAAQAVLDLSRAFVSEPAPGSLTLNPETLISSLKENLGKNDAYLTLSFGGIFSVF